MTLLKSLTPDELENELLVKAVTGFVNIANEWKVQFTPVMGEYIQDDHFDADVWTSKKGIGVAICRSDTDDKDSLCNDYAVSDSDLLKYSEGSRINLFANQLLVLKKDFPDMYITVETTSYEKAVASDKWRCVIDDLSGLNGLRCITAVIRFKNVAVSIFYSRPR